MKRVNTKENTLLYTQLVQFESDEHYSATAENLNDAKKLIEGGFEYVCTYPDTILFKKCKYDWHRHIELMRKSIEPKGICSRLQTLISQSNKRRT